MADVNVLITFGLGRELVERIREVDSRLRVSVLSPAQRRLFRGGRPVWRRSSEMALATGESEEEARRGLDEALAEAEILFSLSAMPVDLLSRARRLKWIQLASAGADRLVERELFQSGISVTTAGGIHVTPIGEYVLGMMIMLAKGWPHLFRAQQKGEWARLTPQELETHHIMGELAFQAMKPSAYLINVSPGAVVDETALVRALKVGLIGGAGLDVFESEPLPPESELWRLHNVIISPHIAGETPHYNEGAVALFSDNLRRYLADEPLLNLVDPQRGY